MPLNPTVSDIALRIALTLLAGALLGLDRDEHGHTAGLRTTILVALAACLAMIQVNLLLPTAGKPADSFNTLDLMRLPLGILSGMGFIGGGAILRRGPRVRGITTAATLWLVTVLGLCFGGGQYYLGLAGLVLGGFVLAVVKRIEHFIRRDYHGTLRVVQVDGKGLEEEIRAELRSAGYKISKWGIEYHRKKGCRVIDCDVTWKARSPLTQTPSFLDRLKDHPGVQDVQWSPQV